MYTFRYHLVTICSVFIALALGLLLGAAIASSELVQSTSDDMVEGVMERYEELVSENVDLQQSANDNANLVRSLTGGWSVNRLDGRTIVLLLGDSTSDRALRSEYTDLLASAGASVVNVTVLRPDFALSDEEVLAELQKVVPKESGVEYQQTLADVLIKEWSYVYTTSSTETTQKDLDTPYHDYTIPSSEAEALSTVYDATGGLAPETAFQSLVYEHYPLTRALLSFGIISIEVDYSRLANHVDPEPSTDQLAAFAVATAWQLPYNINGLINGFVPDEVGETEYTRVGIQLTLLMQQAGEDENLSYPAWLRSSLPKSSPGEVEQPSYYALLIQVNESDTSMVSIASANDLSCVTTPNSIMGRYSTIALLTGAQAGIYGDDRSAEYHYAPLPQDTSGRAAFR